MFDITITERKLLAHTGEKCEDNASIIVLAYPQEVVRVTDALYSRLLRFAGIGTKGWVRAGHSCMAIVRHNSPRIEYFDFGRYIAPAGYARARGANTDPEVAFEIEAKWRNGEIANMKEIVGWIYNHPEKTRGDGDLYASVCNHVNYERVMRYVEMIQANGVMPYGPFVKGGTNCCRFVTDALLNGVMDAPTLKRVKRLYRFTPSVLTNVEAANAYSYYWVASQEGVHASTRSIRKIQRAALMDWGKGYEGVVDSYAGSAAPPLLAPAEGEWQWLGGIGLGVWFKIEASEWGECCYTVSQYDRENQLRWRATFEGDEPIDLAAPYRFTYPSHYGWVTIESNNRLLTLKRIK